MKKPDSKLRIIFLVAGFLIFSACSPKTYQVISNYQFSSPAVQTEMVWPIPQGMDKNTKLAYAIGNDEAKLYLLFQTGDRVSQMKILRNGLEMEMTVPGRENEPVFLKYPVPEERITVFEDIPRTGNHGERQYGMQRPGNGRQNPPDPGEMLQRMLENQKEMMLKGFLDHPDGMAPLDNMNGVCLDVNLNREGILEYRIAIPLNSLTEAQNMAMTKENDFFLEIRLNALERPAGSRGGYGSPSIPGAGGTRDVRPGGTRVDMPHGGRPRGGPRDPAEFSRFTKNERIRIAFKLAESQ